MDRLDMGRFTLRISKNLLCKFGYIAEYYGRTKNKELERMVEARIDAFEAKNGEIVLGENGTPKD